MSRLYNDPARFAEDAAEGFVSAHRHWVRAVPGGVIRRAETPSGQVAVTVGGAAEPAPDEHINAAVAGLRRAAPKLAPGSSVIYGSSAGIGVLSRLADGAEELFLGRFAHDPKAFATVLDEAIAIQFKTVAS